MLVLSNSFAAPPDDDADGVPNKSDNCVLAANPGQEDWNANGVGDACDDSDSDTVLDSTDNCPLVANLGQEDLSANGVGDACEDVDGDGSNGAEEALAGTSDNDPTMRPYWHRTINGDGPYADYLGRSVSGAGDVNNDGYADFIIGAPGDDTNGFDNGTARVYSGLDNAVLYTVHGDAGYDQLGTSVSGAGDVDGDGYADFVVGAPYGDSNGTDSGYARVYSGVNGSILHTFYGAEFYGLFGNSVGGAGDVNGDGYMDLIIGASREDNDGSSLGTARVYSGVNFQEFYQFGGKNIYDQSGHVVGGAGDVNGDGYADLIVGAGYDDNNGANSGTARVYSGLDGTILYAVDGDSAGDRLGISVSASGDVNGDGYADFIVGAYFNDVNGGDSGMARVYSGIDGGTLHTVYGNSAGDYLGNSVSGAGDINGDGYADFIVGAYSEDGSGTDSGAARVYSGLDGVILYTLNGDSAEDRLGVSVSGIGDIDGDGYSDVIAGAYWDDNNGPESGSARIFLSSDMRNDIDSDFIANGVDEDRDGDGVINENDPEPDNPFISGDIDFDGIDNLYDNCPVIENAEQENLDGDLLGDACDSDIDNDTLLNEVDNCPLASNLDQLNTDNDTEGDACDDDDDNDATLDVEDAFPLDASEAFDTDLDGIGNNADLDDDNDGMPDSWENSYLGMNPLFDDAQSDLDGDGVSNIWEYKRGADPTDNLSFPIKVDGDLDGDGDGDLIFQDVGGGLLVSWIIEDMVKEGGSWGGEQSTPSVSVIADIDADFDSDILFQAADSTVTAWAMESGTLSSSAIIGSQSGYTLSSSAGDLDNDNDADLIFEDGAGNIIVWIMQNGAKQSASWLGTWAGQTVAAVGDIDNDGDDDIITQDAFGNVNVIEMENGAKVSARWVGQWAGRTIVGAGDADGDGDADIFMESTSPSGDVMIIEMQSGLKVTGRWLGTWAGTEVKAIGDIDQDGDVDLIQQNTGSGSVQVVEIQNANKVTGRWLGTFAYDVKGVIDADGDGDVDVAMQDGSGNVALIELENGSKVGGAKWLRVNTIEMKLFP